MNVLSEMVDDLKAVRAKTQDEVAQDVLAEALRLSSGTLSYADLAKMDHPYAKRHGEPRLNPSIINAHTEGGFRDSWRIRYESDGSITVYNDSPHASFLEDGTPKMFRRPIDEKLRDMIPATIEQRLRERLG